MKTGMICALAIAALLTGGAWAETPRAGLEGLATPQDGRTMRASSSDLQDWRNGNGDARPIKPGETLVLAELKGPGEIRHIWNTIASSEPGYSRLLLLRIYWDDETTPSVECPVGDFFGIGHGVDVPYDSLPIRVSSDGRGRNCYWPMPFAKSAKLTVTNEGRKRCDAFYYYIDWQQLPKLGKKAGYFHAQYRQEHPAVMGRNYLIADIQGKGQYVGTVLNWRSRMASWPGEGDDFFYIDGEAEPSLRGTGTEDYFCDGWGFRKQAGVYYGAPLSDWNLPNGFNSVYRWHIADPVTFSKSLKLEIEHKGPVIDAYGKTLEGYGERPDDFSSVAFWYQKEPHRPFEPIPVGYARLYVDPEKAQQAETLVEKGVASEGKALEQKLDGMNGGAQLFWMPSKAEQKLSLPLAITQKGSYDLYVKFTAAPDYGIYQLEVDGKPVGVVNDLYSANVTGRETAFCNLILEPGEHTLTFVNKGKNKNSKGFGFGMDTFNLVSR